MKTFYLLRNEDVHGHAGLGVVAEGVIFDDGGAVMTWLTKWKTTTTFENILAVHELHSHSGRTEVIVEGARGKAKQFEFCKQQAKLKKKQLKKLRSES